MARRRRILVETGVVAIAIVIALWAVRADAPWWDAHWFRHRCATTLTESRLPVALRTTAAVVALALVTLGRPWLGRYVEGASLGRCLRRAAQIVVPTLFALLTTDVILRWRDARRPQRITSGHLYHVRRQELGVDLAGRRIHYALNRDGFRTRRTTDVLDRRTPTILLSGESVALGYGLDYDETIGAQLEKRTGITVANLAVSGEGNDLAFIRLENALPSFARPLAVVSFVVSTWLERNVDENRAHLVLASDGRLVLEPPRGPEVVRRSPLRALLRTLVPYHSDEAVEITRAILRETAARARKSGAVPLFVLTQCGPRCREPAPWILSRLVAELDARSIRVETDATLPGDIHPSPRGALHYVDAIEQALRDAGVLTAIRTASDDATP